MGQKWSFCSNVKHRLKFACFLSSELISFLIISRIFFWRLFFVDFICLLLLLLLLLLLFNSGSGACLLNWAVMRWQRCSDIMIEFWYSIWYSILLVYQIPQIWVLKITAFSHCVELFSYNSWICAYNHLKIKCKQMPVKNQPSKCEFFSVIHIYVH